MPGVTYEQRTVGDVPDVVSAGERVLELRHHTAKAEVKAFNEGEKKKAEVAAEQKKNDEDKIVKKAEVWILEHGSERLRLNFGDSGLGKKWFTIYRRERFAKMVFPSDWSSKNVRRYQNRFGAVDRWH